MSAHAQYLDYIRNTTLVPLPTAAFDDDWEPIGPQVRERMVKEGLITVAADGIRIVEKS